MNASVIVDVLVKNCNKPFTYTVPPYFMDVIEKGMRVKVPFGNRLVLGFVIDLNTDNDFANLKPIEEILDITPALTKELVDLAIELSRDTVSLIISCIQAMLPPAIKAKYIKKLVKKTDLLLLNHYFNRKGECDLDNINKEDYKLVKKAILNGGIEVVNDFKDKLNIKYETYCDLALDYQSKVLSSQKQKAVLSFMEQHPGVKKAELLKQLNLSPSTYKLLTERKLLIEHNDEVYRDPYKNESQKPVIPILNDEQRKAFEEIKESFDKGLSMTFLLHGITGSGKTEVYLHVIEEVLKANKEAIMLVPEISLTPQIVRIFKERLGSNVAVLHSGLSTGEKYDEWRKIRNKKVKVVVGARSAIFAPLENIGVIIIDEEHEETYKQGEIPLYHAIEVAKKRVNYHKACLILGSATPSLESYARAVKGVYRLLELTKRATNTTLPKTQIVNMTNEFKNGNLGIISEQLKEAIAKRLSINEQIILLQNRRGYENFTLCRECGYTIMCPNCDISLTYHKSSEKLKCHYCGHMENLVKICPNCHSKHLSGFGFGTEKVEEELYNLFPNARILRMDYDTTTNKGDHERIIEAFRRHDADILLGTQMIAKGLDFFDVTLVGIINADTTLKLPDYKASEKTFQLLTQVSGRAGRHKENSEVIIQTYNPLHYAIVLSSTNNYKSFFNSEMKLRRLGKYIPYYYMSRIVIAHEDFEEALKTANEIYDFLKQNLDKETILLGPLIPQVKRINNIYSSQIIIKYKNEMNLKEALERIILTYSVKKVKVIIDMYPTFLL